MFDMINTDSGCPVIDLNLIYRPFIYFNLYFPYFLVVVVVSLVLSSVPESDGSSACSTLLEIALVSVSVREVVVVKLDVMSSYRLSESVHPCVARPSHFPTSGAGTSCYS